MSLNKRKDLPQPKSRKSSFSLVIENPTKLQKLDSTGLSVGTEAIDRLIDRIRGKPQLHLGFTKTATND